MVELARGDLLVAQMHTLLKGSKALRHMKTEHKHALRGLFDKHPQAAVAAMKAQYAALETTESFAAQQQKFAALSEYTALVAARGGSVAKTLALQRTYPHGANPIEGGDANHHVYDAGVLQLDVDASKQRAEIKTARLDGISRIVGPTLLEEPLLDMPFPVLIRVTSALGTGVITRNDHGVIRATGAIPGAREDAPEANKIDGATALVNDLLSRPLSASGVKVIQSNDTGEHPDHKASK